MRGTPAPDAFLTAAPPLGVPPARCGLVVDLPSGGLTGKAAGLLVDAVPCAATRHEYVAADVGLSTPEALPSALRTLGAWGAEAAPARGA